MHLMGWIGGVDWGGRYFGTYIPSTEENRLVIAFVVIDDRTTYSTILTLAYEFAY